MGALLEQITEWLKGMLVDGIMNNLSGMFDAVNRQVAGVATQVGGSPASFSPGIFALVQNVSKSVIIPIAGMFLTFIACYELIQLIIEHNMLILECVSESCKMRFQVDLPAFQGAFPKAYRLQVEGKQHRNAVKNAENALRGGDGNTLQAQFKNVHTRSGFSFCPSRAERGDAAHR